MRLWTFRIGGSKVGVVLSFLAPTMVEAELMAESYSRKHCNRFVVKYDSFRTEQERDWLRNLAPFDVKDIAKEVM